jgi:CheY-like chemotaxis protein
VDYAAPQQLLRLGLAESAIAIILAIERGLILLTSSRACERFALDEAKSQGDGGIARILIVDDEPDIRYLMRMIFEGAGHQVTEARHGLAGLKSVKARQPDLVTTDVMMPMMDGLEFIERLRADPDTAAIPILVVSGNSDLASAANTRIGKPFLARELLSAVARLIREDRG